MQIPRGMRGTIITPHPPRNQVLIHSDNSPNCTPICTVTASSQTRIRQRHRMQQLT
uniref:Uncharacterized protein n=1 Tax=Mesocestoides corti TaxID=53468 RepID=A0A5K3FS31_MESCO